MNATTSPYDPRAYYLLTVVKYRPRQSFKFLYSDFQCLNDEEPIDLPRAVQDMVDRGWFEYVPAGILPGVKLTELGEDVYLDAAGIHERFWLEHRCVLPDLSATAAWHLDEDPHVIRGMIERTQWKAADKPNLPDLFRFITYGLVNHMGRTALGDDVLHQWHKTHPEGYGVPELSAQE